MENNRCEKKSDAVVYVTSESTVTLTHDEYVNLVRKATRYDTIVDSIRSNLDANENKYSVVNTDLLMTITGMNAYKAKPGKEGGAEDE